VKHLQSGLVDEEVARRSDGRAPKGDGEGLREARAEREPALAADEDAAARSRKSEIRRRQVKRSGVELDLTSKDELLTLGVELDPFAGNVNRAGVGVGAPLEEDGGREGGEDDPATHKAFAVRESVAGGGAPAGGADRGRSYDDRLPATHSSRGVG
jgi:hypothetical protein